jgi:DEAD/DEAH box helicase domain-containing protein
MAADLKTECKAPEKEYKATESRRKRPARYVPCNHSASGNLMALARLIFYDAQGQSGVAAKAFDHGEWFLFN